MTGSAVELAKISARITTIGTARAALDVCAVQLAAARTFVDGATYAHLRESPVGGAVNMVTGAEKMVADEIRDRIAIVESLVSVLAGIYRGATPDLFDEEISTLNSMRIANAIQRTNDVLNSAMEHYGDSPDLDLAANMQTALAAAASAIQEGAAQVLQGAANVVAGVASAFWLPLTIAGTAVGLVLAWRAGLLRKAGT